MKRHRSLFGWCGLGLTVAAVAGGAYAGKRYAEQNMLAVVLGSGVKAESVQWHWRQAAGCAEQVEIPAQRQRCSATSAANCTHLNFGSYTTRQLCCANDSFCRAWSSKMR